MAKPPREVDKPGEMCSYNPKTGKYSDRWLWEEMGEDFSGPPATPTTEPIVTTSYDPNIPDPVELTPDDDL